MYFSVSEETLESKTPQSVLFLEYWLNQLHYHVFQIKVP